MHRPARGIFWERRLRALGDHQSSWGAAPLGPAAVPSPGGSWAAAASFRAALFMALGSEQREIC